MSESPSLASLELSEARVKDDDWTGKSDPAERRRRQNRLHQRAWRRRKALAQGADSSSVQLASGSADVAASLADGSRDIVQLVRDYIKGRQPIPVQFEVPESRVSFWDSLGRIGETQRLVAFIATLKMHRQRELLRSAMSDSNPVPNAPTSYMAGNLDQHVIDAIWNDFAATESPLPVDHQIFVLVQFNALRGMLTNMSILLHLNGRPLEGWEDFDAEGLTIPPEQVPLSMRPTYLQETTWHEAWIDIIPYPPMRDNIIRNQDTLDNDDLCNDFLGGMAEGLNEVQDRGLILWGEPWAEEGWEISEGFARKWSALLMGCGALVDATNRYRQARDEEPLIIELQ